MEYHETLKQDFPNREENKIKMDNNCTTSNSPGKVKSTAVVKYSVPKPANFLQLQCNTDLKVPPSNWLTNSTESYGLQNVLYSHKGFTSFRMAHMFPDCVGEVDVVSDSENIKNLLKIPYNKGHISMMVHRVENTLLLDDFDMYKHLLRTAESEWEWLRKFFFENVESDIIDEERLLYIKNKRQKALKQKHLVSKFLYHSLVEDDIDIEECATDSHQVQGPLLPEPPADEETPDSTNFDHKYNRNVVWTFEDIEMLIGTDMPIFGGGTHPCISLRLRDMKKPINVLTGIDYWLDNLMSNVPEVVMCYHLDGIVQKYELIKTEDLPSLKDSKFNPKLIRDVAQSILSFLKSNATKAGHTYWLFKGKDEDIVKLYDLTSLCSNDMEDPEQNPFTVPVAMLLYRVARNMKHSRELRQPGTIRMLLKNCVKLLNEEKYPEIVTSSHYMLSDLYVPADTNPENPKLDSSEDDETSPDDFWNYHGPDDEAFTEDSEKSDDIKTLILSDSYKSEDLGYKPPPPIAGSVEERALQALHHIEAGINCLKYFKVDFEKEKQMREEESVPMAKQNEPIPMPYEKLNKGNNNNEKSKEKDKEEEVQKGSNKKRKHKKKTEKETNEIIDETNNALLLKNKTEAQPLPTWQGPPKGEVSWKEHLKTLLYEKAVLVYAILSEDHFGSRTYGSSLRCLGLLVRTLQVMSKLKYSVCTLKNSCIWGRAGDCCVMIAQNWSNGEEYRNQFHTHTEEDLRMLDQIEKDEQFHNIQLGESSMKGVLMYDIRTIEQILYKAVECYQEALKLTNSDCLSRRLANSLNEVGSFYLNKAKIATKEDSIIEYCQKSEPYLKQSVEIFERIKDEANIALVYTNIGHLHRLLAHASTPQERGELTTKEKFHYNKAFANYNKALQVIGDRKHCPNIWDAVKWELSTALFTMGTILHENPSVEDIHEAEKEVIEVFQRALKACDFDENNPKYPLYQYRAATIYYRLGSLYHKHIWSVSHVNESNRKNIIQLSKLNYEKAAKMFFVSMDCVNYLTAQMQRFALTEYLAENASNAQIKYKLLQQCLGIVIEIDEMVHQIVKRNIDVPPEDVEKFDAKAKSLDNFKSCSSLLILVKQRLQHILKTLIKLCLQKPPINKESPKLAEIYKNCYTATFSIDKETAFYEYAQALDCALQNIAKMQKNI